MLPCWANQNPSLKPPIFISSRASDQRIPKPKEATNQTASKATRILMFDFQ